MFKHWSFCLTMFRKKIKIILEGMMELKKYNFNNENTSLEDVPMVLDNLNLTITKEEIQSYMDELLKQVNPELVKRIDRYKDERVFYTKSEESKYNLQKISDYHEKYKYCYNPKIYYYFHKKIISLKERINNLYYCINKIKNNDLTLEDKKLIEKLNIKNLDTSQISELIFNYLEKLQLIVNYANDVESYMQFNEFYDDLLTADFFDERFYEVEDLSITKKREKRL